MAKKSGKKEFAPVDFIGDKIFRIFLKVMTSVVLVALVAIFVTLTAKSVPALKEFGMKFFSRAEWAIPKSEVKEIKAVNNVHPVYGTPNDKMIVIEFTQPMDIFELNEDNIHIMTASGEIVEGKFTIPDELLAQGLSNQVEFIADSPLKNNQSYTVSIDKSTTDILGYPLKDGYEWSFVMGDAQGEGFEEGDLTYESTGEVAKVTTDMDRADKWFGSLPFLTGTLITSLLALALSLPFSLAISIFLGEYFKYGFMSDLLKTTNELLAGIPSVIYGFWAFHFLAANQAGSLGLGYNIFTASVVLAIMIIPYSASLAREVISLVPSDIKEAAYAMGATRFEVIKRVILPYASSGIFAGVLLAFGRALGETMAVTMVIGNNNSMPTGLFESGQTIASLIANEYNEARGLHQSSLILLGVLLFIITMLFGLLGRYIIKRLSVRDEK